MTGVVLPFSMGMNNSAAQATRGFASFKCTAPIQYMRRCARDALIQASLESEISSIEPLDVSNVGPEDAYFVFAVVTQGRRCAIILTDHTNGTSIVPPDDCHAAVAINRASILADPVKTAARTIWSYREIHVPPLFSVRLMRRLKAGPAAGLRLGDLEDDLVDEPKRWIDYTLAMACLGTIAIDYRSPITDETRVRINPVQQSHAAAHWLA